MLFTGMRVINNLKKRWYIWVSAVLLVCVVVFLAFRNKNNKSPDFSVLLDKSETYTISDIFDFEFDRAYINDRQCVYADAAYFEETLNVKIDTDIKEYETGVHNHILFVKDDLIIFDYVYAMNEIEFMETGVWVYPDTVLTAQKTSGIYVNADVIQIQTGKTE